MLENNLPIDTEYYLENQLSKPLTRIFEPIIEHTQHLFRGEHTRVRSRPTPTAKKGIMAFTKSSVKCMGCRALIPGGSKKALCKHCLPREAEIYASKLQVLTEKECARKDDPPSVRRAHVLRLSRYSYAKLWSQCQRCQGSFHADVLCSSTDCPIFYMRKKVQKDLSAAQEDIDKFSW